MPNVVLAAFSARRILVMNILSPLVIASLVSGLAMLAVFLPWVLAPARARAWLARFPRSLWPGRILAAVDVVWFAGYVLDASLPWVDVNRWAVFLGAPLLLVVIVVLVDDLLAVRAFGALLLLAAQPLLDAAFPHASAWRLVLTTFAYVLVAVGCVLVWSPYLFRQVIVERLAGPRLARRMGVVGVGVGAFLVALGLGVYPWL